MRSERLYWKSCKGTSTIATRASEAHSHTNAQDNKPAPYDAERIRKRSEMIGYAIAARHQRFPEETPYNYRPHLQSGERYRWDEAARAAVQGYNRNDLVI